VPGLIARQQLSLALVTIGFAAFAGCATAVTPVSGGAPGAAEVLSAERRQPRALANDTATSPTAGKVDQNLRWESVDVPNIGRVRMAVARPPGYGSFPTIVILHGSHGFAAEYLDLARDFARGGVLAVAVCWFSGGVGQGRRFLTLLNCPPGTPDMTSADSDQAFATIDSVVAAVRAMPDSRDDQIALFGHSRGGGAVRNYLLRGGRAQAGIMNSAGYPASADVSRLNARLLILHGTADDPADGGSEFTNIRMARAFEAMLRTAHKPVEAHYYCGGTHNGLFANWHQRSDEVRRILRFLHRHFHLRRPKQRNH